MAYTVRLRFLDPSSHALLILAGSSKSKSQFVYQQKWTLAKLAYLGRHQNGSHEVPDSISTGSKLFTEIST